MSIKLIEQDIILALMIPKKYLLFERNSIESGFALYVSACKNIEKVILNNIKKHLKPKQEEN